MTMSRALVWPLALALAAPAVRAQATVAEALTRPAPSAATRPAGADSLGDVAIDKLSSFLARYPESRLRPNVLYQLAELLVRRADDAFAAAQRAGGDVPTHPDYAPAIARYRELTDRYPRFEHADAAAYTLGTLYFTGQRYADAAAMFERVTRQPASAFRAESYFRLGDARFELASAARGEARRAMFVRAAQAYDSATSVAPPGGDIYFLALYKLGWSYYNQATRPNQPEYQKAVEVFGRLVSEYDRLSPERQARLGLRGDAIEYMAVAFTQVGGADAASRYFATHGANSFELPVLRRIAASLRDQGDFAKAVEAYQAVQAAAPTDSSALAVQREIIDIYQNRVLEPERAQDARLALVDRFAPDSAWARTNPALVDSANRVRETMLRQSAQFELAHAQRTRDRARFAAAAGLYGRYMSEFAASDSAQAVDFLYGEALFGEGEYLRAGAEYARAAYQLHGDQSLAARAGQNAIVSFDSAVVRERGDSAARDSLFSAVDRYVAAFPRSDVAPKALIEKGRRASEARRWDIVAQTFQTYVATYPSDPYTPTAQKLIGDALYKQGKYTEAQAQWEKAQSAAEQTGRGRLADSISLIRNAAAVTYGDSLVKAGDYQRAAEEVYVAYADRNPTSEKAPDALRNAIETYVLADSAARAAQNASASIAAKQRALDLTDRLVTQYPRYKYRTQYQALETQLLADLGRRDEAVRALDALIRDNPDWPGRADAMVRRAVALDSLSRPRDAAAAYEAFATAYPKDPRAADAQYNAALTYLQAADTADAARAYGEFAARFPRDARTGAAQQTRVALLRAAGDSAAADRELARLCVRASGALASACAERTAEREFRAGVEEFARYQPLALVIPTRGNLTRRGIERLSAPKRRLLSSLSSHFGKSIATGLPVWLSASSYYVGLAQWEYGEFLKNVKLPADLTPAQVQAAQQGAARQAEQYYAAARTTWQTLVDKAAQERIANPWVDRARAAVQGSVDASPPTDAKSTEAVVVPAPADTSAAGGVKPPMPADSTRGADSTKTPLPADTTRGADRVRTRPPADTSGTPAGGHTGGAS
ncbi:MAG TPA: tetratricopeptide repeat protein [Gemmatimonadaceae bacterium]